MSTIGIRKSNVLSMTPLQRKLLKMICDRLDLGDPALYVTSANVEWFIFDDERITGEDIALLGRLSVLGANLSNYDSRSELRAELRKSVIAPIEGDTPQDILTKNGAPTWIKAANSIPDGLTPSQV